MLLGFCLFIFLLLLFFPLFTFTLRVKGDWGHQRSAQPFCNVWLHQSHRYPQEQGTVVQVLPLKEQAELPHLQPESSWHTLSKHLSEQTDSGNYVPITPPRQQHKYNKHVINPANKIIPRVRLLHLPSLTHLPTPLSKSFNHSLCHLESWDTAAAAALAGYQETLFTGFVKKTEILGWNELSWAPFCKMLALACIQQST